MQTTFSIPGIHCASCAALIKDVSSEFSAIKNIEVDMETKKVILDHDESFDRQKWTQAVESLGETYKISLLS